MSTQDFASSQTKLGDNVVFLANHGGGEPQHILI